MKDDGTAYDQDGIEDLSYINAGHRWAFGQGELSVNLALGAGDFEESLDEDRGEWVQAGLRYEAPLGKRFKWFTEYQGDFVKVGRTYETNKVIFHTVKFGLSIPLGQASNAPFRTPNFRAPIANAGEMN